LTPTPFSERKIASKIENVDLEQEAVEVVKLGDVAKTESLKKRLEELKLRQQKEKLRILKEKLAALKATQAEKEKESSDSSKSDPEVVTQENANDEQREAPVEETLIEEVDVVADTSPLQEEPEVGEESKED
jgi:hypothetical protein